MFPSAAKLLLIGTLVFTSGCSLVLVDGPPDFIPADEPVPQGACTTERTMPFVDAIGAGAFIATALTSSDGDKVRIGAVLGGALGYSSYMGFRRVGRCRARVFRPAGPVPPDTILAALFPDFTLFPPRPVVLPRIDAKFPYQ